MILCGVCCMFVGFAWCVGLVAITYDFGCLGVWCLLSSFYLLCCVVLLVCWPLLISLRDLC